MEIAGIGIDDMFVITACWYNLQKDKSKAGLSLAERGGLTMEHAGVSVTVTSITDILAFGIGAFTVTTIFVSEKLKIFFLARRLCQD